MGSGAGHGRWCGRGVDHGDEGGDQVTVERVDRQGALATLAAPLPGGDRADEQRADLLDAVGAHARRAGRRSAAASSLDGPRVARPRRQLGEHARSSADPSGCARGTGRTSRSVSATTDVSGRTSAPTISSTSSSAARSSSAWRRSLTVRMRCSNTATTGPRGRRSGTARPSGCAGRRRRTRRAATRPRRPRSANSSSAVSINRTRVSSLRVCVAATSEQFTPVDLILSRRCAANPYDRPPCPPPRPSPRSPPPRWRCC